jgi:hypothetical protein
MTMTKNESYRRSAGKEQAALSVARRFFDEVVGIGTEVVTDKWENILCGDLRFRSGLYAECKGQPIDPYKYDRNFVEVCEATQNPDLVGGMGSLASLLGMSIDELVSTRVMEPSGLYAEFGYHPLLHNSLESISCSRVTLYVNSVAGHVYAYGRNEIIRVVSSAVRSSGMRRGAGNSHEDTYGALVDLPLMRWELNDDRWDYFGPTDGHWGAARIASVLDDTKD